MKSRLIATAAAVTMLTLTSGTAAMADGPAFDDGTPSVRLKVTEISSYGSTVTQRTGALYLRLRFPDGRAPATGTMVHLSAASCGQVIKEHTQTQPNTDSDLFAIGLSPDGTVDPAPNAVNNLVGDDAAVLVATTTEPGYASYSITIDYTFQGLGGPTCDEVRHPNSDPAPPAPTVSKWSTKKRNTVPKVGRTLKVTPTRAPGAKVTYMWKVGAKVVDRDRAVTVKKAYRGKKITLVATVSKSGAKTLQRKLGYGVAR